MQLATKESLHAVTPTPAQSTQKQRQTAKDLSFILLDRMEELVAKVKNLRKEVTSLKSTIKGLVNQQSGKGKQPTAAIETMATRLASLSGSTPILPPTSLSSGPAVLKNKNSLILDLSQCPVNVNERPVSDIRKHLQACLKANEETKQVVISGMKRDSRMEHRYFLYFESALEESAARIHPTWLHTEFVKAHILSATTFSIKVNGAKASAVLDSQSGRTSDLTKKKLSEENGNATIARIGWLSKPDKAYGSMVVSFSKKDDADRFLAKGLMEVGGESAYTAEWKEMKIQDRRSEML